MELLTILITVFVCLPIGFLYFVVRLCTWFLSLFLKHKHSILLKVTKCGFTSLRDITIEFPRKTSSSETPQNLSYLVIKVESIRLHSLYLDRSCKSLLSISANNITISEDKDPEVAKLGLLEFRVNRIGSDFFRYYKENFNVTAAKIILESSNFQYQIDELNVIRESVLTTSIKVECNKLILSDSSIPILKNLKDGQDQSMNQRIGFFKKIDLTYHTNKKDLDVVNSGDSFFNWSIEFHLTTFYLFKKISNLVNSTLRKKCDTQQTKKNESDSSINFKFTFQDILQLGISLTDTQTASISTQGLKLVAPHSGHKIAEAKYVCLNFDQYSIVTCMDPKLTYYPNNEAAEHFNRQQYSCGIPLKDKFNPLLCLEVDSCAVLFPYDYDFATASSEHLMGIIKWIKLFMKGDAKPTNSYTTEFDMNIRISKFSFEIEDDPFELKLRNNYMLLEDESKEQQKREQSLQGKIMELKRTDLMHASSNLEELNKALAKKHSDIYIQRSKQLYGNQDKQATLFSIMIEDADLKVIADSSFHEHEDLKFRIHNLDPGAPFNLDTQFSTLWCRVVSANFKNAEVSLRDFQMSVVGFKDLTVKGLVIGSEQMAAARARRNCFVHAGRNTKPILIERSMTSMKFFHDLHLRSTLATYTHGPCWEPILQQVALSFEKIIPCSKDPSPSLSWWDRMRFMFHGPIKVNCNQISVALHASNDPYNETELIELCMCRAFLESTSGRIQIKGDLDALLHTASKYDECRFVHIPNIDIVINLEWNCLGNPKDHFSVMPCAPDKVPDYSTYHNHDSYRSFRSQSLNMSIHTETQFNSPTGSFNPQNMPSILLYGSTIRWLESSKFIFVGVSKLTRRGKLFSNTKPRKPSIARIFKNVKIDISLSRFQIFYWSSTSKKHGIHLLSGEFKHSSEHTLTLLDNASDGLKHRQQAYWHTNSMNSSLSNVEIWLYNLGFDNLDEFNEFDVHNNLKNRQYFLSLKKISYKKEVQTAPNVSTNIDESHESTDFASESQSSISDDFIPSHRITIYDLKGAWTKENREVILGIYEAFMKNLQLKRNLSTAALKPLRLSNQTNQVVQQQQTQQQQPIIQGNSPPHRHQRQASTASMILINTALNSNVSSVSKNRAVSMLHKLIADSENNPSVYTEEAHGGVDTQTHLYGVEACQMEDVVYLNCLIELVNSQVVLCGTETPGYVIVSASNTEIRQSVHAPVWKNRTLLSKTTWNGSFKDMQYYATVNSNNFSGSSRSVFTHESDIQWLEPDNIDDIKHFYKESEMFEDGEKVGGGLIDSLVDIQKNCDDNVSEQLQRIISKCNCLFYIAKHTPGVSEALQHLIPPLHEDEIFIELWDKEVGVDSFTLTHKDLDISTNSQQYAIVMDIINNLLLYVEPHKQTAFEQQERMRFRFQLSSDEDQREPISQLQKEVRKCVIDLRQLEKERYYLYRMSIDDSLDSEVDPDYRRSLNTLSMEIRSKKEQLNIAGDELAMMINCYKETLLGAHRAQEQQAASQHGTGAFFANVIKRNEICFNSARWRVTDSDGQLGLADTVINNFLYSKVVKSDESVEHTIELGHIHVLNLIPNQHYTEVLHPTELQANIPLDRQRALRVYCRELAPVGGIPVKEHLEVNVVPFTIEMTLQFFQKMVKFFFPYKDAIDKEKAKKGLDIIGDHQTSSLFSKKRKDKDKQQASNDYLNNSLSVGSSSGLSSHTNPLMNSNNLKGNEDTLSTMSTATISSTTTTLSLNQRRGDDIEKMRERASKNHTFVHVKIPGIPIKLSYKGKKQKSMTDLKNMNIALPTFEYHNQTWTWLDLLMAVKNDSKSTVIKQALKQKMKITSSLWSKTNADSIQNEHASKEKLPDPVTDEEKARILLGQYAKGWRVEPESPKPTSETPKDGLQ